MNREFKQFNWRKIGYGSGVLAATLSAVFALGPSRGKSGTNSDKDETVCQNDKNPRENRPRSIAGVPILTKRPDKHQLLQDAIQKSRSLCKQVKDEMGLPGLTVAVSVNGKLLWKEGFGFANLENKVKMKPESVLRIASISKSMTMAMLAKLMEEGKIDIDKPIQTYLPDYPEKYMDGEKVVITTRHLLSHLSGIRHYEKKESKGRNVNDPSDSNVATKATNAKAAKKDEPDSNDKSKKKKKDEMELSEYFLMKKFESVEDSLKLFQEDELFHKPGTKYLYSTHAWTVVSAIIEKLTEREFPKHSRLMFDHWGLKNTYIDYHSPIIYNRASYYTRKKDGVIINSPYVDNSYKWAGGGFLSTVIDLNQFANILLYSMQAPEGDNLTCGEGLPKIPFLKQSTIAKVWTGDPVTARPEIPDTLYALGFQVGEPLRKCMFCKERNMKLVGHGGAAIGSSSTLLLAFPDKIYRNCDTTTSNDKANEEPDVKGVVVSMITNLTSIGLSKTANEIANAFQELM